MANAVVQVQESVMLLDSSEVQCKSLGSGWLMRYARTYLSFGTRIVKPQGASRNHLHSNRLGPGDQAVVRNGNDDMDLNLAMLGTARCFG